MNAIPVSVARILEQAGSAGAGARPFGLMGATGEGAPMQGFSFEQYLAGEGGGAEALVAALSEALGDEDLTAGDLLSGDMGLSGLDARLNPAEHPLLAGLVAMMADPAANATPATNASGTESSVAALAAAAPASMRAAGFYAMPAGAAGKAAADTADAAFAATAAEGAEIAGAGDGKTKPTMPASLAAALSGEKGVDKPMALPGTASDKAEAAVSKIPFGLQDSRQLPGTGNGKAMPDAAAATALQANGGAASADPLAKGLGAKLGVKVREIAAGAGNRNGETIRFDPAMVNAKAETQATPMAAVPVMPAPAARQSIDTTEMADGGEISSLTVEMAADGAATGDGDMGGNGLFQNRPGGFTALMSGQTGQIGQIGKSEFAAGVAAAAAAPAIQGAILDFSQGLAWIDTVAREVASMASQDGDISFDLAPERLGKMHVSMEKDENGIKFAFHVSNSEAANILSASQTQLKQELSNAGVNISGFDIGNQASSGDSGDGRSASGSGADGLAGKGTGNVAAEGSAPILGRKQDPNVRFA